MGVRNCSVTLVVFGVVVGSCMIADAQTQGEMTKLSCEVMKESEARLEAAYKDVTKRNPSDKAFLEVFQKTQRAWTTYRDLYIESVYPHPNEPERYGSVYDACRCELATEMNEARLVQIEEWTVGVEEGDVCVGSRVVKR